MTNSLFCSAPDAGMNSVTHVGKNGKIRSRHANVHYGMKLTYGMMTLKKKILMRTAASILTMTTRTRMTLFMTLLFVAMTSSGDFKFLGNF